jgi:hypothetical protein
MRGTNNHIMLKILGYNYTIDFTGASHDTGVMGRTISYRQAIEVASGLTAQQAESTILHELIEAINFHLRLDMQEHLIACLETGIYQVLTDNGVSLAPLLQRQLEAQEAETA